MRQVSGYEQFFWLSGHAESHLVIVSPVAANSANFIDYCRIQNGWTLKIVTHAEDRSHFPWPQLNGFSLNVFCVYITSENML